MSSRRPYKRTDRLGRQLKEVLAVALQRETREDALHDVVVTEVEVTRDLSLARVFFYTPRGADLKDVTTALERASGFLRRRLGEEIRMRQVPELRFVLDQSIDRAERIEGILAGLRADHDDPHAEQVEEDVEDREVDDGEGEPRP